VPQRFKAILGALVISSPALAAESAPLRPGDLAPVLVPAGIVLLGVAIALIWQRGLLKKMRAQAERLRLSEERLRHVLEGSRDGFWDWDIRTNQIERSERWASMLGYALSEIAPTLEAAAALVHPDDLPGHSLWKNRLLSGEASRYDLEYRMKTKTGEWRWILDRGQVVARDAAGQALRIAGTHTDITERKHTEAALVESQALLKRSAQLLDQAQTAAHIGGWETDLRTSQVYWTAETYRIHEISPAEFTPTRDSIYQYYTPDSRKILLSAVEKAIHDGTPYALELELTTAKGRRIMVHTTGVPERENARVVKLYGSFRDITAERASEQEREKLRLKMLEAQKLESLGVMAGGIAHDFNNLLTAILANASFVRGMGSVHDERMVQIETAAKRAADLCRQMLSFAGKGSFIIEPVDLGALVNDTLSLIRTSISKKARLELDLAHDLPLIEGDVSQLRQLLINLVINASESLGANPGEIRLSAGVRPPELRTTGASHSFDLPAGDCVCLSITDTGQGMNAATLARIFDPFFTTKFAGRGLGLAAVLGIVRAHKGALTVDSTPGAGSTFRLYLPIALTPRETASGRSNPPIPPRVATGTVLIADDEPVVREAADLMMRHHGYKTVLAADGHEAVRSFQANPNGFYAVLLDLTMPGLDGAEVLRVIRAQNPRVPVLMMSGFSEKDVFDRLRGFNDVGILRKPFTHAVLLRRIADVVKATQP
jgi:PAS domain S-box-containing protein